MSAVYPAYLYGAVATIYDVDRTESATAADLQTAALDAVAARTETLAPADSQTGLPVFPVAESEALAAADQETAALTAVGAQAEALTAAAAQAAQLDAVAAIAEALAATDAQEGPLTAAGAAADALTAVDDEAAIADLVAVLDETLSATDAQDATTGSGVIQAGAVLEVLTAADAIVADHVPAQGESTGGGGAPIRPRRNVSISSGFRPPRFLEDAADERLRIGDQAAAVLLRAGATADVLSITDRVDAELTIDPQLEEDLMTLLALAAA